MKELEIKTLYPVQNRFLRDYLKRFLYPWEALNGLEEEILRIGRTLDLEVFEQVKEDVWIAKSATISTTAQINGPTIICEYAEVRHCAFIRGIAFIGEGAVVGNSTELKKVILMDCVQVPHYNYIGDSMIGYRSHLGAGAVTSNLKSDKTEVFIRANQQVIATGLKKVGAFLGDEVEVGCNSVLNPGTVIGKKSNIYPLSMVRGYIPEKSIYKKMGEIIKKDERA